MTSASRRRDRDDPPDTASSLITGATSGAQGRPRGHEAERERRADRQRQRDKPSTAASSETAKFDVDAAVAACRTTPRSSSLVQIATSTPAAPPSEREQKALDQELPQQAQPARAERETDRDLLAPRDVAGQQESREVGARHQQDAADDREEEPGGGRVIGLLVEAHAAREPDVDAAALVEVRATPRPAGRRAGPSPPARRRRSPPARDVRRPCMIRQSARNASQPAR